MIEVEAKVIINDPAKIRKKIKAIAKFVKKEKKIDDYYANAFSNKFAKTSFRIRKHPNYYEINSKHPLSYISGVYAKKENEVRITNPRSFIKEMEQKGFKRWIRKEKLSEIYEIKKNFHIELNKLKHLGYFLEIEYLTDKNVKDARNQILHVIEQLGIHKNQITKKGYTKMLWEKGIRGF